MFKIYDKYINTANEGQTIIVEHNLDSLIPFILLYEPVNVNDYKAVPLYDARITSIESKGRQNTLITFNSPFEGYVNVLVVQNERNSVEDRVARLEDMMDISLQQQKQLVSHSQWTQMNTYLENQTSDLNNKVADLSVEIDHLKSDVDAL